MNMRMTIGEQLCFPEGTPDDFQADQVRESKAIQDERRDRETSATFGNCRCLECGTAINDEHTTYRIRHFDGIHCVDDAIVNLCLPCADRLNGMLDELATTMVPITF